MNRNDLISQSQLNIKTLNEVLEGLGISKDLEDFTDEHLKLVQTIQEIRKDEKVQSWSEAIAIYRKPIREGQLNEAAARHQMAPERIEEILSALKLKPETLTDAQLEQFSEVCAKLQTGVELAAAVPVKATRGKKAVAMPELVSQSANEDIEVGAIAIATPTSITALEVSEADQATLRDMAEALAPEAVPDLAKEMVMAAGEVSGDLKQVAKQIFMDAALKQLKTQNNDPQRAVEMFRKLKRGEAI
jgi:hypothetical protein